MATIPQIYRDKIESSAVGTPGVNMAMPKIMAEAGQAIGEGAQPWIEREHQIVAKRDEAQLNTLRMQHNMNMLDSFEKLKVQYADAPDKIGPAMADVIKNSIAQTSDQATNPRVKLAMQGGDPGAEFWNMKMAYQWSAQQDYKNTYSSAVGALNDSLGKLGKVASDPSLSAQDLKDAMVSETHVLATGVKALGSSLNPQIAPEFEDKGMKSYYKQLIDTSMEVNPARAAILAKDPEVVKAFSDKPGEIEVMQSHAEAAMKAFPQKNAEATITSDLATHGDLVAKVQAGQLGYSAIDAAQRMDTLKLHQETYKYLKDIDANIRPEEAASGRDAARVGFINTAKDLGMKFSKDGVKLATSDGLSHQNVRDLYKLQDEILGAQARGIISPQESKTYLDHLYKPLVAKTLQIHQPNGPAKEEVVGKVADFQAASKVLDSYLSRTGQKDNISAKINFYDAYFKASDDKMKPNVLNEHGVPYTAKGLAHSVVGEGVGSMMQTPFGLREITKYNTKTEEPIYKTTPEDDAKIGASISLKAIEKRNEVGS